MTARHRRAAARLSRAADAANAAWWILLVPVLLCVALAVPQSIAWPVALLAVSAFVLDVGLQIAVRDALLRDQIDRLLPRPRNR